jgi:hypothetical protein
MHSFMLSMYHCLRVVDESIGSIVEPTSKEGFPFAEASVDVSGLLEDPNTSTNQGKPRSII